MSASDTPPETVSAEHPAKLIGLEIAGAGAHPQAWRRVPGPPAEVFSPQRIARIVSQAETAGFAFAFFPDGTTSSSAPAQLQLDSIETASFVSATTDRIALVAESNTTYAEPFHLSNQLSSLDRGSRGRAGWVANVIDTLAVAEAYGKTPASHDASLRDGADVIAAVKTLWDTWEDDVLIADEQHERFFDLARWHHADFVGSSFQVKGPGLLPRPLQGQLPVFTRTPSLYIDNDSAYLIDIALITGADEAQIRQQVDAAQASGIRRSIAVVEIDLHTSSAESGGGQWAPTDALRLEGSPEAIAATLASLLDSVDGVLLRTKVLDDDLSVLADELLPALRSRVALAETAPTRTLRELLSLERPANVFAEGPLTTGVAQ